MSKIGKKIIIIPDGVEVKPVDNILEIKGKNGAIKVAALPYVKFDIIDKTISFYISDNFKQAKSNWGTFRALVQNAITGVSAGFVKTLEIEGVGYRALLDGNNLILNMGFSHPVKMITPEGIKISVEKNIIKISGADKFLVGKIAAEIRAIKKPEPYKGKGIKYQGEIIKRKEGKKVAGATK